MPNPNNFATGVDAFKVNRKVGEHMIAEQVERLGIKANELLETYQEPLSGNRPRSYAEVDEFWEITMK